MTPACYKFTMYDSRMNNFREGPSFRKELWPAIVGASHYIRVLVWADITLAKKITVGRPELRAGVYDLGLLNGLSRKEVDAIYGLTSMLGHLDVAFLCSDDSLLDRLTRRWPTCFEALPPDQPDRINQVTGVLIEGNANCVAIMMFQDADSMYLIGDRPKVLKHCSQSEQSRL